jgi:hypothetical protein
VPLAMVPVGRTLLEWGDRRWVRAAFAILAVVSLDALLSYNSYHYKDVGRMVDHAASGWTPNLLFPWTHAEPWRWRGTHVLLLLWAVVAAVLLLAPLVFRASAGAAVSERPVRRLSIPMMIVATLIFVILASGATALGGEWTRNDYFPPFGLARQQTIEYGLALDRCRACYSSFRGITGRGNLVEDTGQRFTFSPLGDDVRVGEESLSVATAIAKDGRDYGTLAVDFGDGHSARTELFGSLDVRHVYASPGVYRVSARFAPHGSAAQHGALEVRVRPDLVSLGDAEGLPSAVADAPQRGTIARIVLEGDRLTAALSDGSPAMTVWLLAWQGDRWRVRAVNPAAMLPGWVVAIAADPAGSWRSAPVTLRWPDARLLMGVPTALFP